MESQPLAFLQRELETLLDQSRAALAELIGGSTAGLVFVNNATAGVNTVLRSWQFQPGESLLVTDHGYNACRNAVEFVAARWQAQVRVAEIPCPLLDGPPGSGSAADQIVAAIEQSLDPTVRMALIDHVTSPTGIVFPIARIVELLHQRGIVVIVDGAHAPGMLPLNVEQIGADFYTGNCHKWLCAPKGAGFLHVAPQWRERLRPLVISHGANSRRTDRSRLHLEFDWTGTGDPTPWICVADAIDFLQRMPGGIKQVMEQNRQLTLQARSHLLEHCQLQATVEEEECIGSIASLILPELHPSEWPATEKETTGHQTTELSIEQRLGLDPLQIKLWRDDAIEVPVFNWPSPKMRILRIAAQQYNDLNQYRFLASALQKHLA